MDTEVENVVDAGQCHKQSVLILSEQAGYFANIFQKAICNKRFISPAKSCCTSDVSFFHTVILRTLLCTIYR